MTDVCKTLKVARSNIAERVAGRPPRQRGRPPLPDDDLLASIRVVIAENPAWGYIRIWAHLRRLSRLDGRSVINRKRIYRVMKVHGLLLTPNRGDGVDERRHDGRIGVNQSNRRWCSDGFEIACDNAEKVRVAFALDCCDREAMAHVATTAGIRGEDIRDLMVTAVEHRFGRINRLPETIEWLTDNGSCYLAAETRHFARQIGLEPLRTPISSPQSNGMAEAFVKTFKRDFVNVSDRPNAQTVLAQLQGWFDRYNRLHPHSALGYRSPREFIAEKRETVSDL
jgi:putative transposase